MNGELATGSKTKLPPAIVAGGDTNAMCVARSLHRMGVRVHALNVGRSLLRHSRACRWIMDTERGEAKARWEEYLLGPASDALSGAVFLACSDDALEILIEHREAMERKFLLDIMDPASQRRILDKLGTAEEAAKAGVPAPRHWNAETDEHIEAVEGELVYPLILKPHLTYRFAARVGRKFLVANDFDEVRKGFALVRESGTGCLLLEKIPGPDHLLRSYFTYIDERGEPVFHYTKGVMRRFPVNEGGACYHISDDVPEVAELGLRFTKSAGLRGLSNVEFKRDPRDGVFKLIECNARFTAALPMLAACGLDLGRFVYRRIAGLPNESLEQRKSGVRMWYPVEDFKAFLALRRAGEVGFLGWVRSICHRKVLPFWSWRDPFPSLVAAARLGAALARRIGRALAAPFRGA